MVPTFQPASSLTFFSRFLAGGAFLHLKRWILHPKRWILHLKRWMLGTMGMMYWMLNSPYPSANWGSIDVDGNWRLTHYGNAQHSVVLFLFWLAFHAHY